MIGAIIGDIAGSDYEFNPVSTYDFELFPSGSSFTDDSILTVAVGAALLEAGTEEAALAQALIDAFHRYGAKYPTPKGAYGGSFSEWLRSGKREPYNSWGNGSAMRVSAVIDYARSLEEAEDLARITAAITHNHEEGIKGAQATAAAGYLARTGSPAAEIREYISRAYGYDLTRTCTGLRAAGYGFEDSCQKTVPESLIAFLEADDFESAIRNTIYLRGDADTMGAITGAVAEQFFEVPQRFVDHARETVPEEFLEVIDAIEACR